ncbi:putative reverse transcriptase domain-containing protein [Tanacetum coccineum]|uniref:Reverse transcriptase domain-containing protein n=1 Tax=Tanacetum coccineum TaxID=301880 RepID=A0ABQ4Y201_9ASTR
MVHGSSTTPKEDQRNKFAPYPLPPQEGNMNGWLIDDPNDSDLESTASNQPMSLTMEDIGMNWLSIPKGCDLVSTEKNYLPQRQVEFRIDLIPGAMPVAKSPYRLAFGDARTVRATSRVARQGIYSAKSSPWGALSSVCQKKDGSLHKNQKYEWGEKQEEAFQMLKDNLCNASILSLPDGVEDFVVYCDASNQGLRCVLMQRDKCDVGVKTKIMDEAHKMRYSVHPGADKMYYDLRDMYWWSGMKKEIAIYVSKCLTCAKVEGGASKDRSG